MDDSIPNINLQNINTGFVVILSAPSGAGKTTLCNRLQQNNEAFWLSISCTTRQPRYYEEDAKHYFFIDQERFLAQKQQNYFLETTQVFDHFYGTPLLPLQQKLQEKKIVLLDVDWQGALNIHKKLCEKSLLIFICPPSLEELSRRLMTRNTENDIQLQRRLGQAAVELTYAASFDYVVTNDNLDTTEHELLHIIKQRAYNLAK